MHVERKAEQMWLYDNCTSFGRTCHASLKGKSSLILDMQKLKKSLSKLSGSVLTGMLGPVHCRQCSSKSLNTTERVSEVQAELIVPNFSVLANDMLRSLRKTELKVLRRGQNLPAFEVKY